MWPRRLSALNPPLLKIIILKTISKSFDVDNLIHSIFVHSFLSYLEHEQMAHVRTVSVVDERKRQRKR